MSASRTVRRDVGQRYRAHHNRVHGRTVRGHLSPVHGTKHVKTVQGRQADRHHMAGRRAVRHTTSKTVFDF